MWIAMYNDVWWCFTVECVVCVMSKFCGSRMNSTCQLATYRRDSCQGWGCCCVASASCSTSLFRGWMKCVELCVLYFVSSICLHIISVQLYRCVYNWCLLAGTCTTVSVWNYCWVSFICVLVIALYVVFKPINAPHWITTQVQYIVVKLFTECYLYVAVWVICITVARLNMLLIVNCGHEKDGTLSFVLSIFLCLYCVQEKNSTFIFEHVFTTTGSVFFYTFSLWYCGIISLQISHTVQTLTGLN